MTSLWLTPPGASQWRAGAATFGSDQSGVSKCRVSCVGGQPHRHLHPNRSELYIDYTALCLVWKGGIHEENNTKHRWSYLYDQLTKCYTLLCIESVHRNTPKSPFYLVQRHFHHLWPTVAWSSSQNLSSLLRAALKLATSVALRQEPVTASIPSASQIKPPPQDHHYKVTSGVE